MRLHNFLLIVAIVFLTDMIVAQSPPFRLMLAGAGRGRTFSRRSTRQSTSCMLRGQVFRCGLSITCLFTGGLLTSSCGNGLSCCRRQQVARPSRRRRGRGFRFGESRRPYRHPNHHHYQRFQHLPQHHHRQEGIGTSLAESASPPLHAVVIRRRPLDPRFFSLLRPSSLSISQQRPSLPTTVSSAATTLSPHYKHFEEDHGSINNEIDEGILGNDEEQECGRPYQFLRKRIIGGQEAGYGELPWQAHIRILGYQCGGVIVSRSFIVTAAHCVHKANMDDIKVHLGEYDTKNTGFYPEPYPSEVRSVVEVRIHPLFHYMLTQPDRFDVAVLRVNRQLHYRPNILPICLPLDTDDFTGHTAMVAGWGKTDNSFSKTGTNVLNKAPVPIITNNECLRWHHQKHIELQLHAEMFCAGHETGQRDACLGDSGGPLIVLSRERWTLAGITSAGFGCAIDRQPGIYHKVSTSTRWIQDNIRF